MIPKNALTIIQAIKDTRKKLPINDSAFLSNVALQAVQGRMLTEKQAKYLQDVYQRVTDIPLINGKRK